MITKMTSSLRKVAMGGLAFGAGAYLTTRLLNGDDNIQLNQVHAATATKERRAKRHLPPRDDQIKSLQSESFDVLIIGGGASGAGCALDAVTREKKWWQVPYYWFGIKMYDIVAGTKMVKSSYVLSKKNALEYFPMLQGDRLCGAIVYYDGKEWDVKAKCVINATGPMTDTIRKMDDPKVREICAPSSGVHIVLPGYYSPDQMGLLDPATSDGRVIFFLPWLKHTIAGTTDLPCEVTHNPKPTEDEILFILEEVKNYLNPDVDEFEEEGRVFVFCLCTVTYEWRAVEMDPAGVSGTVTVEDLRSYIKIETLHVRRGDVLSAWSGIRPLVQDPNKADTQSIARNHIVHVSDSNLITIAGGKWTTYRAMAEHTIDAAIKACNLKPQNGCQTDGLRVEGAHNWTPTMYIRLVQDVGLECEVAQHLAQSYGDRAFNVAKLASLTGKRWPIIGKKIHPEFPYIDAEKQLDAAQLFLQYEMGQMVNRASREKMPINLAKEEIQAYIKRFQIIDSDRKGYVSINDIRRSFKMMSAIKSGHVTYSRFARVAEMEEERHEREMLKRQISVERSGGGL
ncbi:Glycerol-3-phosphate dehydrogenase [Blattella germanica]|nr:Glycerol-3-phosphate dehydrogenase [Blattella germanica]